MFTFMREFSFQIRNFCLQNVIVYSIYFIETFIPMIVGYDDLPYKTVALYFIRLILLRTFKYVPFSFFTLITP